MTTLTVESGPVTTVTLNRPAVRNAFNEELISDLTTWATSVPTDGSVRVVVLRGAGASFCAGADLQWMSKMAAYTREENIADATRAAQMFLAIDSLPVPVIGRVHGAALGGPWTMPEDAPAVRRKEQRCEQTLALAQVSARRAGRHTQARVRR